MVSLAEREKKRERERERKGDHRERGNRKFFAKIDARLISLAEARSEKTPRVFRGVLTRGKWMKIPEPGILSEYPVAPAWRKTALTYLYALKCSAREDTLDRYYRFPFFSFSFSRFAFL